MNNIIFDFAMFRITYYSVLILMAVFFGGLLVIRETDKFKINRDFVTNLIFWLVIFGLIGSRIYYVAFNWSYYSNNLLEIFQFWSGGLAIHGAIIMALLFICLYATRYKIRIFRLTDILVIGLILGQAIGRWGNFFNQEAYGGEVTREFLEKLYIPDFIIEGMNIYGKYYHPTFLYESLWCLLGFVVLLLVRRYKYLKVGQLTAVYFIWYSIGRFFVEGLRLDSLMLESLRIAQVVSIIMLFVGLILLFVKGQGSRFQNLYHEKEDINEIKF